MMKQLSLLFCLLVGAHAYSTSFSGGKAASDQNTSRRSLLKKSAALTAALAFGGNNAAFAASDENLTDCYFGVGCFWHIQHEFVDAERKLLGRGDHQLSSAAGYAGGTKTGSEGRVCYHNFQSIADYGKLGHGEVVGMKIPEESIGDFAKIYFSLFSKNGERVDPGDRGSEYRSLIGLPGGMSHPMYPQVEEAGIAKGFTLEAGKGNDPDTFGKKLVYVYDSNKFPFYQAEVYHQYHNDFQSPAYGKEYNNLANVALEDGRIHPTGCPDRV
jgi:peptide methionine sulfoxide reductase MsrA